MKKKIFIFALLTVFTASLLPAKVSVALDVGPLFTHFSNHFSHENGTKSAQSADLGGFNVLLRCEFAKNFGVYGMANFAFGQNFWTKSSGKKHYSGNLIDAQVVYALDSQFGFFYVFRPVKNAEISLGGGFGLGGNGHKRTYEYPVGKSETEKIHCTNIGAGLNMDVSYMFTKMLGIYGGVSDTLYAPVAVNKRVKGRTRNIENSYSGSEILQAGIGKFSNSFSIKAGLQLKF